MVNRIEAIDPAALRRMDLKIRFDPLTEAQLRRSFKQLCGVVGVAYTDDDLQRVQAMAGLCPGDFACVVRRLAFAPLSQSAQTHDFSATEAQQLLTLLADELAFKAPARSQIGFVGSSRRPQS